MFPDFVVFQVRLVNEGDIAKLAFLDQIKLLIAITLIKTMREI